MTEFPAAQPPDPDPSSACDLAQKGDAASIRYMISRSPNCPSRERWLNAFVGAAMLRLTRNVFKQFRKGFEGPLKNSQIYNAELEELVGDFWRDVAFKLREKTDPDSSFSQVVVEPSRFDRYLLSWAYKQAVTNYRAWKRSGRAAIHITSLDDRHSRFGATGPDLVSPAGEFCQNKRAFTKSLNPIGIPRQTVAKLHAFTTVVTLPPPPRYSHLLPPQLVVYFCSRICESFGPTHLATSKSNRTLGELVDLAANTSELIGHLTNTCRVLERTLVNSSPYGDTWNVIALILPLAQATGTTMSEREDRQRRIKIVNEWIDLVGRHVRARQTPGDAASKVLAKLPNLFRERLEFLKHRYKEGDASPTTLLSWSLVRLIAHCCPEDIPADMTVKLAVDMLRNYLGERGESLPEEIITWLSNKPHTTLLQAAERTEFSLVELIQREENRARGRRSRALAKQKESGGTD